VNATSRMSAGSSSSQAWIVSRRIALTRRTRAR
jgi:hypothetical protein